MQLWIKIVAFYVAVTLGVCWALVGLFDDLPEIVSGTFGQPAWHVLISTLVGAVALLTVALMLAYALPANVVRQTYKQSRNALLPVLGEQPIWVIAIFCLVVGVTEELFFRALLQGGLGMWFGDAHGPWVALAVASLVFGLAHAVTLTYAAVTFVMGAVLGVQLLMTSDLLGPILSHALYDFVAILLLLRSEFLPARLRGAGADDPL